MAKRAVSGRELQLAVLATLSRLGSATTADVRDALPPAFAREYTTIATVLGRLVDRRLVRRTRSGRTWRYAAVEDAADISAEIVRTTLAGLDDEQRRAALVNILSSLPPAERSKILRATPRS